MEIRLLNPADAEKYWALRLEALQNNPEAFSSSYEEAIKRENPIEQTARNFQTEGNYTFGAFEDQQLIGMVTLFQERSIKIRHKANIVAVYVTPTKQGQSVGKALLIEAINKAKTLDSIKKINLTVTAGNEKAKNLYIRLGFKVFGYEEKALNINSVFYDEEHMVLHLK